MKKRIIAGIVAALMVFSFSQAFALSETTAKPGGKTGGERKALSEEQKAEMEAERAKREAEIQAFIAGLSDEQKALFDAMMPAKIEKDATAEGLNKSSKPFAGEKREKPDNETLETRKAKVEDMKAKCEAFIASLSSEQKEAFEKLFAGLEGRTNGGRMRNAA